MAVSLHEVDMDKPIDWRDRLVLASDPMTNDLGRMDAEEATEALEYIQSLEATLRNEAHKSEPPND